MNYDKFKDQLGSWGEDLRPFIESKECDEIYKHLKERAKAGVTICPTHYNTFRAFKECPKDKLKCVMVLMNPYPWMKRGVMVADGIPMSCSNTGELQPSLELFYKGMEDDLCEGFNLNMIKNPDLTYLANQGVLMLNSSLTVELNNVKSHKGLWNPLHKHLFENVFPKYIPQVPMVFLGNDAQEIDVDYNRSIGTNIFYAEHPAAASHKGRDWQHNNVFTEVNMYNSTVGLDLINWYQENKVESEIVHY